VTDTRLDITCAIMAGGQSLRMGRDKASLEFGGMTLLERTVCLGLQTCRRVMVIGRTVPADWPLALNVDFIPDAGPAYMGPAAGILTALDRAGAAVLALACDMPLLTAALLEQLYAAHRAAAGPGGPPAATLAARRPDGGPILAEPLLAVYTPAIAPVLREALGRGQRSLQPLAQRPDVQLWLVAGALGRQLLNVNDPEALAAASMVCVATAGHGC